MSRGKRTAVALGLALACGAALALFYLRYVPLTGSFQAALAPILALTALLAFVDPRKGTLLFIFLFPLINSLPYFFGLHEPLPHAPTALVLFLFYFGGWSATRLRGGNPAVGTSPVFRPLALFSALVVISGLITFWRFADFPPFLAGRIYELVTNAYGVSSGGAIMSVVFNSLNYLSGFGFLVAFSVTFSSEKDIRAVSGCVLAAASAAIAFGFYQSLGHIALGNNPTSIAANLVNATFKDALSFGTYLAMLIPLLLGLALSRPGPVRVWAFVMMTAAGGGILISGSKSGLLSLPLALAVFALMGVRRVRKAPEIRRRSLGAAHWSTKAVTAMAVALVAAGIVFQGPLTRRIGGSPTLARFEHIFSPDASLGAVAARSRVLWRLALPMIRDYPVTGLGMGSYIIEVSNYAKERGIPLAAPESAENSLLQVGTELGLAGIALAFWTLLALVGEIRRARAASGDSQRRFVVAGAAGGIAAYLAAIQVHTFIGSYEIKYFFWLLAGLVITSGRLGPLGFSPGEKAANPGRRRLIIGSGLALFGLILLWNSAHSLSLRSRTVKFGLVQEFGLSRTEKDAEGREFRWTSRFAGIPIAANGKGVIIPIRAAHPDISRKPVRVRFRLITGLFAGKRFLGEVVLEDADWKNAAYALPDTTGPDSFILIEVDRTWNPKKLLGLGDSRDLGVEVGTVSMGRPAS